MGQLTIINARDEILNAEQEFESISSGVLNFRKEFQFCMQALEKSDFLLQTALKNPQSLRNAIINVSAIGLSLNPAERLAYILPMDNAVQLSISYIGLLKLAVMDGGAQWAHAEIVREGDSFELTGIDSKPIHSFDPFSKTRGEIKGVYCVFKLHDGSYLTRAMSTEECHKIRNRSKMWIKNPGKGIWYDHEAEMMKKTVIKNLAKTIPKIDGRPSRLDRAIEVVNEHEGIDFSQPSIDHKKSASSELLNKQLGTPTDPENIKIIDSIKSICSLSCEGFSTADKRSFMVKNLQIESFTELYNKDKEFLIELEVYLSELLVSGKEDDLALPKWNE